jgi:hypothetical protein
MAHYLFNVAGELGDESALREQVDARLRAGKWPIADGERHRDALAPGDLALIYIGAPVHEVVGCAEVTSAVLRWPNGEGVLLSHIEQWQPPVPMREVLARIDTSAGARADFTAGVLRITNIEYTTTLTLAHRG